MIQVILQMAGWEDKTVMMPQVPRKGERLAHHDDLENTVIFRVEEVTWIVPRDKASCKALVRLSY